MSFSKIESQRTSMALNSMRKVTIAMALSSGFCIALIAIRIIKSESPTLIFLIWNLMLAWVPYLLSIKIRSTNNKVSLIIIGAVWLVFLPNAPYLFTDLIHLRQRIIIPLWFDIFLCSSFAWTGLLLGLISIRTIHQKIAEFVGDKISHMAIISIILLSSYGLYLGRFLRRNSWELVTSPDTILADTISLLAHPHQHHEAFYITLIVTAFTSICYNAILAISNQSLCRHS